MNPVTAIVDSRLPDAMQEALRRQGFRVLPLPPNPALPAPVAGHPDLQLFADGKTVLCLSSVAPFLRANLPGYEILPVPDPPKPVYPHDVALNALPMTAPDGARLLFCRPSSLAPALLSRFDRFHLIATRQGYARCAVCKVSDRAAVTADRGLAEAMEAYGINVLRVREGCVSLPGYDSPLTGPGGMPGGASGLCTQGEPRVYFFGDLSCHPDEKAIAAFCRAHSVTPVSLCPGVGLTDAGTAFFLPL